MAVARAAERIAARPGLTRYLRVVLERGTGDGLPHARLTGPQGSGVLSSVAKADALIIVPERVEAIEAGDEAHVILLAAADDAQETATLSGD
jgi:molybdopterin molybdotransferase